MSTEEKEGEDERHEKSSQLAIKTKIRIGEKSQKTLRESFQNQVLGPKLVVPVSCVKLGEKITFTCLLWVKKPQINYPWEVILLGPVEGNF